MSSTRFSKGRVIAATVVLTVGLVIARCLSTSPYRFHAGVMPIKASMFYAGSYLSMIGDASGNFTEKQGYALQLGRLQITYMRRVPSQ